MGGSSLAPEVLSITFGAQNFHVLDSTVPAQIKTIKSRLNLEKTLFIVASKSGSTLEPNTFKQYFFERVAERVGRENAGRQFVAITDPNSKMQQVATRDNFRKIFYGNPEIGGRFSALSPFGMAAAAAMNLNVEEFLRRAQEMVDACRNENPAGNPGAILGTILGVCQTSGRDKLTIFTSTDIHDLGAWLEQLIAESTGKSGVSIIPNDREPLLEAAEDYGDDRIFVYLKTKELSNESVEEKLGVLEANGHPVIRIELEDTKILDRNFSDGNLRPPSRARLCVSIRSISRTWKRRKLKRKKSPKNTNKPANCPMKRRFTKNTASNFLRAKITPRL
jgi:hypothetical protein